MASFRSARLVGPVAIALAVVLTSCGLVVRDTEARPVNDAADLGRGDRVGRVTAPTLPVTTIWSPPDVLPSVPGPGDAASPPEGAPTTTEPVDPWCPAFSNFINVGTAFTMMQGQAPREQLLATLGQVQAAARSMVATAPPDLAGPIGRLDVLLTSMVEEVSALNSTEEVLQRISERVGGITPLVDPLITAAPTHCEAFRGSDEPTTAQFGYDALSGQG